MMNNINMAEIKITISKDKLNNVTDKLNEYKHSIENEENLVCHIDVLVEGVEEVFIEEELLEEGVEGI